ncbi:ABC transporter substrate-binding protein, partial [Candidatus Parcubacteria bacterium]|nr:ABC transporter substrate-binding protein [Candidatus Parcubacteria bacterium]
MEDTFSFKQFFKLSKFPSNKQWKHFFSVLNKKERTLFFVLTFFALTSLGFLGFNFYTSHTEAIAKNGGTFSEGALGQPKFLNPLYLSSQDIDRDIVEIIFSGIMKYDENGKLVNDLSESYEIKDESKTFEFVLRDAFWHDGAPVTSDDIAFTVGLIQNPDYQSPLRIKLTGILVEPLSSNKIAFKLPKTYPGFLETLTFKILPKHIFKDLPYNGFPLTLASKEYLVGSGPFKIDKIEQDSSGFVKKIILNKNKDYFLKEPYLDKIEFVFFKNERDLSSALSMKDIDGASLTAGKLGLGLKDYVLGLPRYFALFFNLNKENEFQDKNLRQALNLAINKENIVEKVFSNKGQVADSPVLPLFFGLNDLTEKEAYNKEVAGKLFDELGFKINGTTGQREKIEPKEPSFTFTKSLTLKSEGQEVSKLQECLAKFPDVYPEGTVSGYFGSQTRAAVLKFQEKYKAEILTPAGLIKATGDVKQMTREKLNKICFPGGEESTSFKITITTSDQYPLLDIAKSIKNDLEGLGFKVEINAVALSDLQTNILTKRNFDLLLFGEALGSLPDPFPFWHSSQKDYPGLNIAGYSSKTADRFLETAREALTEEERNANLEVFQEVIAKDLPAI